MSYPIENRTPKEWINNCLQFLQDANLNYKLNKGIKGSCIELIREDDCGFFVSINFFRNRVLGEDSYYLNFALSLTTKKTPLLIHPLIAGSRFNNNGLGRQFLNDLGITRQDEGFPKELWSNGKWRSNTMEHLKRGLTIPEEYLYPHYRRTLKNGKDKLLLLFRRASEIVPQIVLSVPFEQRKYLINIEDILPQYAKSIGIDPKIVFENKAKSNVLNLLNIAKGGICYYRYGPKENIFNIDDIPIDAIILNFLDVFILEKDRLTEIVSIIEKL